MKCNNCHQEIKTGEAHIKLSDNEFVHSLCPSGTKRSEARHGCLPSPTGSAPERSGGAEAVGDYLRRSAPVERSDAISRITEWYAAQCNDEWEHSNGIDIKSLDNPGWWVEICLYETPAENLAVTVRNDDYEILCKGGMITANCEPRKLNELLCAIADLLAADSAQCNGPKAESVAPDEGGSGAQARNAGTERRTASQDAAREGGTDSAIGRPLQ